MTSVCWQCGDAGSGACDLVAPVGAIDQSAGDGEVDDATTDAIVDLGGEQPDTRTEVADGVEVVEVVEVAHDAPACCAAAGRAAPAR